MALNSLTSVSISKTKENSIESKGTKAKQTDRHESKAVND
jgi:hypothetical protein